jgi:hypothetical protein
LLPNFLHTPVIYLSSALCSQTPSIYSLPERPISHPYKKAGHKEFVCFKLWASKWETGSLIHKQKQEMKYPSATHDENLQQKCVRIILFIVVIWWDYGSVELWPLTGPLSIPQMIRVNIQHQWNIMTGEN